MVGPTPRPRILVADDEPIILEEYAAVLRKPARSGSQVNLAELEAELYGTSQAARFDEYFDLCLCTQGADAVEATRLSLAEGSPFSVAFLDVRMPPGIDGIEAAEKIRKLDENINIVIVTGYSDLRLAEIAVRVPPPDKLLYCHKPLHPAELRQFAHALSTKWSTELRLKRTQARFRQVMSTTPVILYSRKPDPDFAFTFISDNIDDHFKHKPAGFLGNAQYWLERIHPEDAERAVEDVRRTLEVTELVTEYRFRHRNGSYRWISDRKTLLRDADGRPREIVGVWSDITERRRAEERIRYLAFYDSLTGLPNRSFMKDMLERSLLRATRNRRQLAMLFLDIDQFKRINDTLGHHAGDTVLREVSTRLLSCLRRSDTLFQDPSELPSPQDGGECLSRIGGDEFVALLSDIHGPDDAAGVARRISQALSRPIRLTEDDINVTASIGISVYPDDGADAETLVRYADTAMYHAKEQGGNRYQFFSPEMNERAARRLAIESSLRRAIDRNELLLHYEPKFDIQQGRPIGAEALLRWRHPVEGLISPAEFIPVAESTGLIVPLGDIVFGMACRQVVAWQSEGLPPLSIAINVSAAQFKMGSMIETLKRALRETGLDPRLLEIEVTESILVRDIDLSERVLAELGKLGIRVSIDDFGTGYSTLSYLKRFTLHALKIDRSLICDVHHDHKNAAIVTAVISLAHNLGLEVVAEGVEKEQELEFLRIHGCDQAQGHFLSVPLDPATFRTQMGAMVARPREARLT